MQALKFDNKRRRVKECPCGKSNQDGKFIPYVGFDTYGYCHSCGETFLPKCNITHNERWLQSEAYKTKYEPVFTSVEYDTFRQTLDKRHFEKNIFIQFLYAFFPVQKVQEVITNYHLGTHFQGNNACIFWYLDDKYICRAKSMLYDKETCIAPFNHPTGICKRQKSNPYATIELTKAFLNKTNKVGLDTPRCFFGAHLLQFATLSELPIGIVEAEKTAIICAICMPEILWLATGGMQRLDLNLFHVLKGREIWLYPDLGLPNPKTMLTPYQTWAKALEGIKLICGEQVYISELLEQECSQEERKKGYDLADYYLAEYRDQFHHFKINL